MRDLLEAIAFLKTHGLRGAGVIGGLKGTVTPKRGGELGNLKLTLNYGLFF